MKVIVQVLIYVSVNKLVILIFKISLIFKGRLPIVKRKAKIVKRKIKGNKEKKKIKEIKKIKEKK
jgi:hypothetical protein